MLFGWEHLTKDELERIAAGIAEGRVFGGPWMLELHPTHKCNVRCFFCSSRPYGRDEVLSWPVRASRDNQVHLVDGRMLTWYGARTASALHALSLLALRWVGAEDDPPSAPPTFH